MPEQMEGRAEYPASELFLDIVRSEYSNEDQRKQTIDTKSGILLALASTLIPVVITQIQDLKDIQSTKLILLIFSLMTGILGIISLIAAVWGYKYDRLDSSVMTNVKLHMMERQDAARALIDALAMKTAHNRRKNNLKARLYIGGALFIVVSLFFFCTLVIAERMETNYSEVEGMINPITGEGNQTTKTTQETTQETTPATIPATTPATVNEATALLKSPCYETSNLHVPVTIPIMSPSPTPSQEKNARPDN